MHGWFASLIQSQKPSLELDDCLVFMFVLRKQAFPHHQGVL